MLLIKGKSRASVPEEGVPYRYIGSRIGSPQTAQRALLDAPFLCTVRAHAHPILPQKRLVRVSAFALESRPCYESETEK